MNILLESSNQQPDMSRLNIKQEAENYQNRVLSRLKIRRKKILPYKNDYLPIIAKRAIDRMKPSGKEGQGFRDVLIWLTLKDYCELSTEKKLTFISNNHSDFGYEKADGLHAELLEECKKSGIEILYFKTIKDFIEQHTTKIDFITDEWLAEAIPTLDLSESIEHILSFNKAREISNWFKRKFGQMPYQFKVRSVAIDSNDSFSVYEMSSNEYVVNLGVNATAKIEFEYIKDEYYFDEPYETEVRAQSVSDIDVIGHFIVTVEDREIVAIEPEDVEL